MKRCRYCGQEIDWITSLEGKPVPVDPDPVFVIEDGGPDTFLDDVGAAIVGRQAGPEEIKDYYIARANIAQSCGCLPLEVAFIPHRRTCPWADHPARRHVESNTDAGGLAPAT